MGKALAYLAIFLMFGCSGAGDTQSTLFLGEDTRGELGDEIAENDDVDDVAPDVPAGNPIIPQEDQIICNRYEEDAPVVSYLCRPDETGEQQFTLNFGNQITVGQKDNR